MGDRACYREYCPNCDGEVTIVDEECPHCGRPLEIV
jgi:rRNA maturation protein Nop10